MLIRAYTVKLDLKVQLTNVGTQNINGSNHYIFKIAMTGFQINDKLRTLWFFQKTFLMANTNIKMILRMFFRPFSNEDILFANRELIERFYITAMTLLMTKQVEILNKEEFVKVTLDKE